MPVSEVFGAVAVLAMALFYALEDRSDRYVLLFAAACLASCAYAVVIRSWPFAGVELLWAGLAFRRWTRARSCVPSSASPLQAAATTPTRKETT